MHPHFRARRCARGTIEVSSDSNTYPVAYLFNNSTGPELLVVRDMQPWSGTPTTTGTDIGTYYLHGTTGSQGGTITPLVPSQAILAGQLWGDKIADPFTPADYLFGGFEVTASGWIHDFPFAVLEPGWSLALFVDNKNSDVQIAFYWQVCHPAELDGIYEQF